MLNITEILPTGISLLRLTLTIFRFLAGSCCVPAFLLLARLKTTARTTLLSSFSIGSTYFGHFHTRHTRIICLDLPHLVTLNTSSDQELR
jgi:hypothetical protein